MQRRNLEPKFGVAPPYTRPFMPSISIDPLAEIARHVEERHGIDFGRYKPRCLMRRLNVRMRAVGADDLEAYAAYLVSHHEEADRLVEALAINFSFFYRDRGLFRILGEQVLPDLVRRFPTGPLRIWSAGCAAGEEIYSLGILALETLAERDHGRLVLIGTDIDPPALEEAREGIYNRSKVTSLDNPLIEQYFHPDAASGMLRVRDALRTRAQFRRADLLGPTPYRGVSLICCRNVMIYLQPQHQERILEHLASALRPGGVLALGRVERLTGDSRRWFDTVDAAERVYRRKCMAGESQCS
ncbi:MAG: protein-glutamate O-methyltransferase CheR [Acidobacteria bacterium]|nr:protein-glutamate O-methyltransferase CheR [Acidobacteriota bacterium]